MTKEDLIDMSKTEHPLLGMRILVTRPIHQADDFMDALTALGAEAILFPTIEIRPIEDTGPLDKAIRQIEWGSGTAYDWLVLTSVNGVAAFWERLDQLGFDSRLLSSLKIAAIGPATAEALKERQHQADLVPEVYTAEGVLEAFDKRVGPIKGQRFLLARADIARKALAVGLGQRGAMVDEIAAYRTAPVSGKSMPPEVDIVTFTSSSTVQGYVNCLAGLTPIDWLKHSLVVCIGPITAGTARELELPVHAVAQTYTIAGLLEALKGLPVGRA